VNYKIGEKKLQQQSKIILQTAIQILITSSNTVISIESLENEEYNAMISYWQCLSELKIFAIKKTFFSETPTVGV
jgi:CRISPR/Cas system-associated endonuclease Cas1